MVLIYSNRRVIMKLKNKHIKILQNFLLYNNDFGYDGSGLLKTKSTSGSVFLEAFMPDFIDLPLYTRDLSSILSFVTPESDVTEDYIKGCKYFIIKNENGTIRYRLAKEEIVNKSVNHNLDFDSMNFADLYFSFNLDKQKYDNLKNISKKLECDMMDVYSIDNEHIGLTAYKRSDKEDKQYTITIEKQHEHNDKKATVLLGAFNLVNASDYNIEIGLIQGKTKLVPVTKVKAFCDDIVVKYIFVNAQ